MKAIHINPNTRTICEIEIPRDGDEHMAAIYKTLDCSTFDCVRLSTGNDAVFVDDEGLFRDDPRYFGIDIEGYRYVLAGHGLVIGANDEGESSAPAATVANLTRRVRWFDGPQAAAAWQEN